MRVALSQSLSAPATISEALALPPLIRMASGWLDQMLPAFGKAFHVLVGQPPLRVNDQLAVFQKQLGYRNRLVQEPARIVAQVENQGGHALRLQFTNGFLHLVHGRLLKTPDLDVPHVFGQLGPSARS